MENYVNIPVRDFLKEKRKPNKCFKVLSLHFAQHLRKAYWSIYAIYKLTLGKKQVYSGGEFTNTICLEFRQQTVALFFEYRQVEQGLMETCD